MSYDLKGFKKPEGKKVGITCGAFDLLHAGHCLLLQEAKANCDYLVVCLQTNPNKDRPNKHAPIQTMEERRIVLSANRYIDFVIEYDTEADLYKVIQEIKPDVYTLGNDWREKKATGWDIVEQKFHDRTKHDWSTTSLRKRVYEAERMSGYLAPRGCKNGL